MQIIFYLQTWDSKCSTYEFGGGHDDDNDAKNKILGIQSYFLCCSDKPALIEV